jgi:prepilin-type processing-associated H-X9-DG protein/prepilin-type N-terminal cleavage/methylation domain-containing protein
MRGRRVSSGTGFTIIELMLVIALLAILLSLLLPVFTRGRELAYRTRCAANLKQFGVAFSLYSQDWAGYWPCPGGLMGDRSYWSQTGSGGLNAYVRQQGLKSIWCCPLLTEWAGKYPPRSYSMNSYLRTPCDKEYPTCTSILTGVQILRITRPSETILLYEGVPRSNEYSDKAYTEDQVYYIYRCANWTWARGYFPRVTHTIEPGKPWHGRMNNYLYCDGHVTTRPPGKKTTGLLSTYSEMREWYADKAYFETVYQKYWSGLVPRD